MMETTKTGKKYYVGERQQEPTWKEPDRPDNAEAEFERQTGYQEVEPEIKE